jgi:hypothetical protein
VAETARHRCEGARRDRRRSGPADLALMRLL